jgi:APA family basic amino acid/polyamine antiporter
MATRDVFAMSRDDLFWKRAAVVNEGGTPTIALALSLLVSLMFIILGEKFETVITVLAFFFVVNYILSFVSLFVLRWREPDKPRPYRAWGYPVTTGLALLGSLFFLVGAIRADTKNSVYALVLLAISYPVFRLQNLRYQPPGS